MLYIKNGKVRDASRIVIRSEKYVTVNPTEAMILADGWVPYEPEPYTPEPTISEQLQDLMLEQYNQRTDISDEDALKRPLLVYPWSDYIGKSLKTGQIVSHNDKLWRVRQDIPVVLENQSPDLTTAALYEVIEVEATGTIDDPIEYKPPMEIFEGKYYVQDDVKYKCTRDSQTALNDNLSDLIGIYVEKATEDSSESGTTSEADGTIDNPIEYKKGDAIQVGLYYVQDGVKYIGKMALSAGLSYDLKDLVSGGFVSVVE